jgi:hypothetical protein
MNDPARRIPVSATTNQPVVPLQEPPLLLEGGVPQTISMKVVEVGGKATVYFSLPGKEGEHTAIEWKCGGYALLLTFLFESSGTTEITELVPVTPAFWFSKWYTPSTGGPRQQGCCVPSLPGTYHFNVKYTHKGGVSRRLMIDPQIVVTPQ